MRAKDVLLESLKKYSGTWSSSLTTDISSIGWRSESSKSKTATCNVYPGNYEDYLWRKQNGAQALEESLRASISAPAAVAVAVVRAGCIEAKKRVNPLKRKQLAERLAKVESEVNRTEALIAESEDR